MFALQNGRFTGCLARIIRPNAAVERDGAEITLSVSRIIRPNAAIGRDGAEISLSVSRECQTAPSRPYTMPTYSYGRDNRDRRCRLSKTSSPGCLAPSRAGIGQDRREKRRAAQTTWLPACPAPTPCQPYGRLPHIPPATARKILTQRPFPATLTGMRRLGRFKLDFMIVAGFLILPLLLFGSVTLGGQTMLPVDNLFQWAPWSAAAEEMGTAVPQNALLTDLIIENYAWKRFFVNSLFAGEIPLWNPYLFGGAPFLATGQHGMLYPFSWLFLILPIPLAYGWYTLLQIWLAGVLMYVFGRVLKMGRGGAAVAGVIYQGSGFLLVSAAVFPMIIGAAVWLPLLLACCEKIIETAVQRKTTTLLWMAVGAAALGVQILAGHIEITYYTLLIMALYAAWRLAAVAWGVWRGAKGGERGLGMVVRPLLWLLGMVLIGLLLGGVQLIPFYEVGQVNFREGSASFAEVRGWAFPARRALTLALPNFFGNPAHHSYVDPFTRETVAFGQNSYGELNPQGAYTSDWGIKNYVEGGIYLGILPLFLALLGVWGLWRRRGDLQLGAQRWQGLFFLLLAFFALAFIFGTPLYALLYYGLPFINQLHTPFRWVWPLALCVAALAGFGVNYLLFQRQNAAAQKDNFPKILAALALLAGGGILLLLGGTRLVFEQVEPQIESSVFGAGFSAAGVCKWAGVL